MTTEVLERIIRHCVGVIGYFDGTVKEVKRDGDRIVVSWDYAGRTDQIIFDSKGMPIS